MMSKTTRYGIVLILIGLSFATGWSQQKTLFKQVVERFGPKAKGIWVQFYKGKADDSQPVLFCVGNDDVIYKGFYTFDGSSQKHFFEGKKQKGPSVNWLETDAEGNITGYIKGTLEKREAQLRWIDLSRQFARDFTLTRTRYPKAGMQNCSDGLWLKTLEGSLLHSPCMIVLQHENEGIVRGIIRFEKSYSSHDLKGTCADATCRNILLHLSDNYGNNLGDIKLQQQPDNTYRATIKEQIDQTNTSSLSQEQHFPILCGQRNGKPFGYAYTYPYLDKKRFDRWLGLRFKRWISDISAKIQEEEGEYLEQVGDQAIGWVDIEYLGPKFAGGFITFYDPLEDTAHREGFIFDFRDEKPTPLNELFDDYPVAKMLLDKEIDRSRKKLMGRADDLTRQWLEKQAFDIACIRAEGFCFSTGYDGIFGERKIIVPYRVVASLLKDKRLLKL